jgi:hypothetical protein
MIACDYERGTRCARHYTLIINSNQKHCKGGCKVIYDETEVRVLYKGKVLDKSTGLWLLPIAERSTDIREKNTTYAALKLQLPRTRLAANINHTAATLVYMLPYKQQQMKYMHQSFYNIPIPTLIEAIQNNQLTGFLCMMVENAKKYLVPLTSTPKGRMKQPRVGIRSAKKQQRKREEIDKEPLVKSADGMEINFVVPTERHVIPEN